MAAARRIDDTKIDRLEQMISEQGRTLGDLLVVTARIDERLKSQDERIIAEQKQIDGIKNNQRWAALAIIGAFVSSAVNFFFRGSN
jgi:hypothetical protein